MISPAEVAPKTLVRLPAAKIHRRQIGPFGRVQLPKQLRELVGLQVGDTLLIERLGSTVVLRREGGECCPTCKGSGQRG